MPSAYISSLNRELAEAATDPLLSKPDLKERFLAWFDSLPEITRNRPFAMAELEQALQTQGKYISPILLQLGWRRKRKWTGSGQYPRFWVPPARADS